MAQFEEQLTAARTVTPATQPLNLYYGLAQAGMAIAAAHAADPWSFNSHGLQLVDRHAELGEMQLTAERDGAFQRVSSATASPGLAGPVSLGALWASLPDLSEVALLPGPDRPAALYLIPDAAPGSVPAATLYLKGELPEAPVRVARLTEIMNDYPSARGWRIKAGASAIEAAGAWQWSAALEWPIADFSKVPEDDPEAFFDEMAPAYRYRSDRFLRPVVCPDVSTAPSALMTWWLLLYSFSILARYEPRRWTTLLDLDKSRCASALQYALQEALAAVPHLVLEALDGERRLFAKPLSI